MQRVIDVARPGGRSTVVTQVFGARTLFALGNVLAVTVLDVVTARRLS